MRKNPYFINILLVVVVGITSFAGLLVKAFSPATVLVRMGIPFLVILSLIPVVLEHYLVKEKQRERVGSILLAGATFTVLLLCAGWSVKMPIWMLFAVGATVFGAVDLFYTGMGQRMSSGPCGKLSPIVNGVMLYLASQCLQGLV